jgi:hypothetical protein
MKELHVGLNLTVEDIETVIEIFKNEQQSNISEFSFNIYEMIVTKDKANIEKIINIINKDLNFSNEEIEKIITYTLTVHERLNTIFNHAAKYNCTPLMDAEQSYLQTLYDYIATYYIKIYNKDKVNILNTLQCYLKYHPRNYERLKNYTDNNQLKLGIKLVRGAYINEESKLAKVNHIKSPICDSFEETNKNYNETLLKIIDNYKSGEKYIIATHNLESIELLNKFFKEKGFNEHIICAQLLGIAEHATGLCKNYVKIIKLIIYNIGYKSC